MTRGNERRVWRYQIGNQNLYIEEEQTTQWPKEKVEKDKQRSIKHIYKTKDRVTRTPQKTGGDLMCSGRVISSCSTSDTRYLLSHSTLTSFIIRLNVKRPLLSRSTWNVTYYQTQSETLPIITLNVKRPLLSHSTVTLPSIRLKVKRHPLSHSTVTLPSIRLKVKRHPLSHSTWSATYYQTQRETSPIITLNGNVT
jgi:hypothetical protein